MNELTGNIPSELGMMSSLQQLWLSKWYNYTRHDWNYIHFEKYLSYKFDAHIDSFCSDFALASNQLTGSIPSDLGTISSLLNFILSKWYNFTPWMISHLACKYFSYKFDANFASFVLILYKLRMNWQAQFLQSSAWCQA